MHEPSELYDIVAHMMRPGKGILAADESDGSAGKRLQRVGLENTPENRQSFREVIITAPDIESSLSGMILFDSTIRNSTKGGMQFVNLLTAKGIMPGIKVDRGLRPLEKFDNETITQGLDDLRQRFIEYRDMGARFAKWRALFEISECTPTDEAIHANALQLARYAAMAQEEGIVPMVEPEVLYDGAHAMEHAESATTRVLQGLFSALSQYRIDLKGTILKSSMVLAGKQCEHQSTPQEVADATLRTFHNSVPHEVGGIVFLSGGQTPEQATANLQEIATRGAQPWPITFSYSRAIQEPMLDAWEGKKENVVTAQGVLKEWCDKNAHAQQGIYTP